MRLLLSAGFDRALHAVALAELARRNGHDLAALLIVTPFQTARLREWIRKRGVRSLFDAARRMAGANGAGTSDRLVERFLEKQRIEQRSLSAWARDHAVALHSVDDLNGERALRIVRAARASTLLYAGGGILRAPLLEAVEGRVLNAHAGPLPHVRGMNACEWSLLLGHAPAVTIHWIDSGIDTGEIVETIPLRVDAGDDVTTLRARCTIAGVEGLVRALGSPRAPLPAREPRAAATRQCFTLAPVLRELLETRLEDGSCR